MSGRVATKNGLGACIVLLALAVLTSAQVMPNVAPDQVGLSKPRLDRIKPAKPSWTSTRSREAR